MRTESETVGNGGVCDSARRARIAFWLPLGVTTLSVGVFVGAIILMTTQMRKQLREGILREDGEVLLSAVTWSENPLRAEDSDQEQRLKILEASDFRGTNVLGVRLFDRDGKFRIGISENLAPMDLSPEAVAALRRGEVLGSFDPHMNMATQFVGGNVTAVGPVSSSTIPLEGGAAQFLLNGERMQARFLAIDRQVGRYSFWTTVLGALLIGLALAWAFSRLNRANHLLAKRTGDLLRANHELALAAKTSAVGAVAAHLIHGLRNPLTGLQLLASTQMDEPNGGGKEWRIAADAAKRMGAMISDIVKILQEDAGDYYEISVTETLQLLQTKVAPLAKEKGVRLSAETKFKGNLANREANLVILALTNLIHNAIQASAPGKGVQVSVELVKRAICFDVQDEAGGIPEEVRPVLFTPCQSTKPGGTGIGLAITKQLASHMGGQLELVETNEQGTRFRLSIPAEIFLTDKNAGPGELEVGAVA